MNDFIHLADGRYYRRDAFITFSVIPEEKRRGDAVEGLSDGYSIMMGQDPDEYFRTGRWTLRGKVDGRWRSLCTLDSYEAVREYALHEFALELDAEPPAEDDGTTKGDADS